MGLNPDQVEGILRRLQSWPVRLLLGLAAAIHRPLIKIFVLEEGGKILGIAMVSFSPGAAQIGGLTVDTSIRRRGHAQELMKACESIGQRYRRPYLILDVLSNNTPAIRLYEKLRYRTIRDVHWMTRIPTQPIDAGTPNRQYSLRPFRPADAKETANLANAAMPPSVKMMIPFRAKDFRSAGLSRQAGRVDAASWVLESGGKIAGFVKAFVSPAVAAAQIGPLVLAQPADTDACGALLRTALAWCVERRAPRVILALPEHLDELRPTLERAGFAESFCLHTMALNIGAT